MTFSFELAPLHWIRTTQSASEGREQADRSKCDAVSSRSAQSYTFSVVVVVLVTAGLVFGWVWGYDRPELRRCLLSHPGGQAGRNEKEREEGGDAIDDRVRGGNHEIRARRRMGPAAEEEKRREPEVPEGIMSNKPPSYTPFSWTLCVTILVTAKGQSSLVKLT